MKNTHVLLMKALEAMRGADSVKRINYLARKAHGWAMEAGEVEIAHAISPAVTIRGDQDYARKVGERCRCDALDMLFSRVL